MPKILDSTKPIQKLYPLSYSSQALFDTGCKRKYQLYKLLNYSPLTARTNTVHTTFGTAVGAGSAILLADPTKLREALHETFIHYDHDLLWQHINSKSLITCLQAVRDFQPIAQEWHDAGYRIATITTPEGERPATEVKFRINVEGWGYYIGFIDVILYNARTNKYRVIEIKTTQQDYDSHMWKNRSQDVGYLFVGTLTGNFDASTCYPTYVCVKDEKAWSLPVYDRTQQDFEDFTKALLLTFKGIRDAEEVGFFPRNGNCRSYGQLCPAFAQCREDIQYVPKLHDEEEEWDIEVTMSINT